jgi:hypothetical protein
VVRPKLLPRLLRRLRMNYNVIGTMQTKRQYFAGYVAVMFSLFVVVFSIAKYRFTKTMLRPMNFHCYHFHLLHDSLMFDLFGYLVQTFLLSVGMIQLHLTQH